MWCEVPRDLAQATLVEGQCWNAFGDIVVVVIINNNNNNDFNKNVDNDNNQTTL